MLAAIADGVKENDGKSGTRKRESGGAPRQGSPQLPLRNNRGKSRPRDLTTHRSSLMLWYARSLTIRKYPMSDSPEPELHALIARAAEMRAEGETWPTVAAAVGRSANTVQKWPKQHARRWKKLFARAEAALLMQ